MCAVQQINQARQLTGVSVDSFEGPLCVSVLLSPEKKSIKHYFIN